MKVQDNIITAENGLVLRRIADKEVFGDTISLGYTYYIGGKLIEEGHFETPDEYEEGLMIDGEWNTPEEAKRKYQEWRNTEVERINADTDMRILSGYEFEGHKVWLSTENQFNYKAVYDVAVQTAGASLPATFKLGLDDDPHYRVFSTLEDIQQFYLGALRWISSCLEAGWKKKDSITLRDYAASLENNPI